ncbi:flavodoxin [Oscillibacter valericigenes]|uniref:flavodoxin n=1 Tax=Oscillibacter valericigenes TaxID=351091 RepID=UPI00195C0E44|nr:flavodoxin [Oscillibacter valericigenes]MBM6909408.1 flavodoxin [Oscillibacter valericigenes]
MKHWKRLLSCVLAGSVALALAACGQQSAGGSSAGNQSTSQSTDQSREEVSSAAQSSAGSGADASGTESGAGSGSVLVVYYSATGNTETVANYIAEATGGDIFEITPAEPYTSDDLNWTDENSRVSREHEDESLRDVELTTTQVENWDSYDTVFIGYPIWWGIAAWPVDGFVEANDFTGKTVIPFCTSSSSGLGESGELLAELAASGDWQEGQRFRSSVSQEDVNEWVDSLGLSAE